MLVSFLVYSFLGGATAAKSGVEAPCPPALTPSNWAIAHGSTWNSDVSGLDGPSRTAKSVQLMINEDNITDISSAFLTADSITLAHSSVDGYIWGSGVSGVYQLKVDDSGLSVINTYFRDFNFEYHGAYSLLAADGTYYAAARTSIQGYHNEVPMDFTTPIVKTKEYFVPNLADGEHIVGLTLTHDAVEKAFLVYATTKGQVGAVSLDFQTASSNIYQIQGVDEVELPDHFVSNSIGMDGPEGGIYVCTSSSMNRLQWDPVTLTVSNHWSTSYGNGYDQWFWGRLGPGCGTSPTVVGPSGVAEYVVITDGESPMNILFYDVKTGALAGKQTVTFGGATNGNSTTDQSIVVLGYKAVVVNNYVADQVTSLCSEWFVNTDASDALKHECPYLFGSFVPGIEQFELNPTTGEVTSLWSNAEVSCTSTVPIVAAGSNEVLYCLGKRYLAKSEKDRSTYTIEAVDWKTGRSLYYVDIGPTMLSNGLYAGTIVGTKGDIVMGTLAGVVRVSEDSTISTTMNGKTVSEKDSRVMQAWNRLAEWSESGHVPTEEELSQLGVKVPATIKK